MKKPAEALRGLLGFSGAQKFWKCVRWCGILGYTNRYLWGEKDEQNDSQNRRGNCHVHSFSFCCVLDHWFSFGSYFVCMFLPLGYIMMAAGFQHESCENRRVSANIGVAFSVIYAILILLVYFAQITSVRLENLNEQALMILDFQRGGLLFNYDLLGYGVMALSTFFIGLSLSPNSKMDKLLKSLMMIHGIFFISCFFAPMTGMFTGMANGETGSGATIALLGWCAYFMPVGILSYMHFHKVR